VGAFHNAQASSRRDASEPTWFHRNKLAGDNAALGFTCIVVAGPPIIRPLGFNDTVDRGRE